MTFYVGQKVVRFRDSLRGDISAARARALGYSCPELGEVVTIRTLNVWPTKTILTFHEHDNSHVQRQMNEFYEPGFNASAFRPLVDSRKSVSFTAGAPKDSEKWDNRKVVSPRHRVRVNG